MSRWYADNKATFWVVVVVGVLIIYWISQNWRPSAPQCDPWTLGLVDDGPNAAGSPVDSAYSCDGGATIIIKYQDGSMTTVVVPSPQS